MIHETAIVNPAAKIAEDVAIWHWTHVREGANIGARASIGQACYIDHDVFIGQNCRIQNGVYIYYNTRIGDDVFIGPGAMLLNDHMPRVGEPWTPNGPWIKEGASIGAGAIIMPGVIIGKRAMIGAGAVVTRNVEPEEIWVGVPAKAIC